MEAERRATPSVTVSIAPQSGLSARPGALVALLVLAVATAASGGAGAAAAIAAAGELATARGGIAFGPQHLPASLFDSNYTGTVWIVGPSRVTSQLEAARRARARVVLNLSTTSGSKTPDGSFSLELWKRRVDRFKDIDFEPYVADGTVLGHYIMDEPHSAKNWNGKPVPFADIEAAAKYSKERWPRMTTFVRAHPGFLAGAPFRWMYVDAAWAQYSARKGDVRAYVESNVASARALGLGLVVGLNLLSGGTSESGIAGYNKGKWAMSARQIRRWGRILAAEPYACALFMWKYDKSNPAYLERPDIKAALAEVGEVAANRPRATCRVR